MKRRIERQAVELHPIYDYLLPLTFALDIDNRLIMVQYYANFIIRKLLSLLRVFYKLLYS